MQAAVVASAGGLDPTTTALGVLSLGFLLGLRHATEADHIAAVGALVSERRGWRAALRSGALWGAGHSLSILLAGVAVLGLHLAIPGRMARLLELVVALMIIALGGSALARALRSRPDVHAHLHLHGARLHSHLHFHDHGDAHLPHRAGAHRAEPLATQHDHQPLPAGWKPLLVGMVHGLAGSAGLTLLVLTQIRQWPLGLAYLGLFGLGSIGGMAVMSLALSLPFAVTSGRPRLQHAIRLASGFSAVAFGCVYAWSQIWLMAPA